MTRTVPRVLLVEDDPDIRRSAAAMLHGLGYAATEAGNGTEALQHLEAQSFDWLVTDLAIPGMPGSELATRAMSRRPSIRIVFASGYDPNETTQAIAGAIFLRKPYDERTLKVAMDAATKTRARHETEIYAR